MAGFQQISTVLLMTACMMMGGMEGITVAQEAAPEQPGPLKKKVEIGTNTYLEKDPETGIYRIVVIDPNGEKQIVQTLPTPPQGGPAINQENLNLLRSLAQGERYLIGVQLQTIPEGLRSRLMLEEGCGLLVAHVLEGKPAARGDVRENDLLLKINGTPVDEPLEVVQMVQEGKGKLLVLTLLRDSEQIEAEVVPEAAKGDEFSPMPPVPPLLESVVPPDARVIGPGLVLDPSAVAELRTLQTELVNDRKESRERQQAIEKGLTELQNQLTELREQNAALIQQVKELQQQLNDR